MPKKSTASPSEVIDLDTSTDDHDNNPADANNGQSSNDSLYIPPRHAVPKSNPVPVNKASSSSSSNKKTLKKLDDMPKRIISRRKSVHHSIRCTESPSFESFSPIPNQNKRRESVDDLLCKKKRWNSSDIDDAVDNNLDDPEIEKVLRKIAYCRVFTNYLLRQYDMLAIDFKLYSNLDLLNLDLKMRVDTYMAIKKSRERFKEALQLGNGQIEL